MSNLEKKVESEKGRNRIVSLILSFLLSVFLLITFATLIIHGFILSGNSVMMSLNAVDYHEDVYEQLRNSIGDTLLPTGLPYSIIDDAFTPEMVYTDLNEYVSSMFANDLPDLQRDEIAERLNYNIDHHLLEIGLSRAEVGDEALAEVVAAIIDNYNDYVSSPFISYIARVSNLFENHLRMLMAIGLAATLITTAIIYLSSRRFKYFAYRYFAFSFGTTALMLIVAPLVLRIWGGYRRLGILPEFVYNFVIAHIDRTISSFLLVGTIFIALYLIFIIISARSRRKLLQA